MSALAAMMFLSTGKLRVKGNWLIGQNFIFVICFSLLLLCVTQSTMWRLYNKFMVFVKG